MKEKAHYPTVVQLQVDEYLDKHPEEQEKDKKKKKKTSKYSPPKIVTSA